MSQQKKKSESAVQAADRITLEDLKGWGRNPRKISAEALAGLKVSVVQFGDVSGIVWNQRNGELVCGHQRMRALQSVWGEKLELVDGVIVTPAGERFPVRVVDWDEEQHAAAAVTANNTGIQGEWDDELLQPLLQDLQELDPAMFGSLELEGLLAETDIDVPGDEDAVEQVDRPEPRTQPGDLYILGDHWLLCGDSTVRADVRRVMTGVEGQAALFATDPPYLVGYESDSKAREGDDTSWDDAGQGVRLWEDVFRTAMEIALRPDAAWYIWHASCRASELEALLGRLGVHVHQQIIWVKEKSTFGRSHFFWQHEPCLFGWVRKHQPPRVSEEHLTTVWRIENVRSAVTSRHACAKPTEVFAIPMRQHLRQGEVAFEPFAGSGAQIIAAELTGRCCRAIEKEQRYCDLIVDRWCSFTGRTRVVVNGQEVDWDAKGV